MFTLIFRAIEELRRFMAHDAFDNGGCHHEKIKMFYRESVQGERPLCILYARCLNQSCFKLAGKTILGESGLGRRYPLTEFQREELRQIEARIY